jgi:hypothetical protein
MRRRIRRNSTRIAAALCALGLSTTPSTALADGWAGNDPARSTAGEVEDHEATSENPEDLQGESHDPDEMVVGSESLEDHEAESENPAAMVTGSSDMIEYEPTSLTDLPEVAPGGGVESISVPGQSEWDSTTDPQVVIARNNLVRAQKRARRAITAYGDAERDNYPRGAARIRIVEERDAAMRALDGAKSALESVE